MVWTILGSTLLIFALRLIEVSMGTIRMTLVVRGKRVGAAVLGFMEVSIWVIAASQVIGHLDSVWNVVGYKGVYTHVFRTNSFNHGSRTAPGVTARSRT